MIHLITQHYKENYRTMVKKLMWKVHQNTADAEDIVQEAYTRAIKYSNTFEQGKSFDKWFSTILFNAFRDWKSEQFHRNDVEEYTEQHSEPVIENDVKSDVINNIVKEIPNVENEIHREVLKFHFIHALKIVEIVHLLDINRRAVQHIISNFQTRMKEKHEE